MSLSPSPQTQLPKKGRPKDEALQARRAETILAAATQLFAERGYAETDVQELADQLQIGKGTIYRYFSSKSVLFFAAVDRGMQTLSARIDNDVAGIVDPLERVFQAIRSYLAFFYEHPELVELFIQERANFKERAKPIYFAHQELKCVSWMTLVDELVKADRLRPMRSFEDHDVMHDLLYGTIMANHFTGRKIPPETQAASIIDLAFHGLLTDSERKRLRKHH